MIGLLDSIAGGERAPTARGVPTPKSVDPRVVKAIAEGHHLRTIWLNDAFQLRHRYAHGRSERQRVPPIWTVGEHLLLMAWIFPIAVKAVLATRGHYELMSQDRYRNWVFDALLEIEPFRAVSAHAVDGDVEDRASWRVVIMDAEMRFAGEQIRHLWEASAAQ